MRNNRLSSLYDPACFDLACHFLSAEKNVTESNQRALAQHIQQAIEDWLNEFARAKGESP